MKTYVPVIFVVGAILLLYNSFPSQITTILILILITSLILNWDSIKANFE